MSYEMALKEHYASIRERLAPPPPVARVRRAPVVVQFAPEPTKVEQRKRLHILWVVEEGAVEPTISPGKASARKIISSVCAKYGVTVAEITGRQRSRLIVKARHEAFYRLKTETTNSLIWVGIRMGGFDHTTVIMGIAKHRERMAEEAGGTLQ